MISRLPQATMSASVLTRCVPNARAGETEYHVTDAERAACGGDAISQCDDAGKDKDKVLACMKRNRASLTPGADWCSKKGGVAKAFRGCIPELFRKLYG